MPGDTDRLLLNRFLIILVFGQVALLSERVLASDFGTTGLIKIPDARMEVDGTMAVSVARDDIADVYNISYQVMPRVQGTFRYTIFNPRNIRGSTDGLRDRSYEIKTELFREGKWVPQVAIGVRDILGTGAWEAEYLVTSKKLGALDATLGLGWGRLAGHGAFDNPLGGISDSFAERPSRRVGGQVGGESRGESFFRGDAAVFGGLAYRFPRFNLRGIVEYNSDDYRREQKLGSLDDPSPWNFALAWRPLATVELRAAWLRGDTFGLTLSSKVDTKTAPPRKSSVFYSAADLAKRSPSAQGATKLPNLESWYGRLLYDVERSGTRMHSGRLNSDQQKAVLVVENTDHPMTIDAVERVLSFAEVHLPASIDSVDVLLTENGLRGPTVSYDLRRLAATQASARIPSRDDRRPRQANVKILEPRALDAPTNRTNYGYPKFVLGADLDLKTQLMDPDDPLRSQIFAKVTGRVVFNHNWNIWLRYDQDIKNDFSTARRSNSVLEHVRSDVVRYLTEGESGLESAYIEYRSSLGSAVHVRGYAGILEQMFAGVGAEALYSPYKNRWSAGVTVNAVRRRGFERNFELLDYQTMTGHLNLHYAMPIYDIDLALHVGRYLAGDRGYTFEARRTFSNGFSLGGFFTRTNVSAEDFGEGSFDKGLYFRIPFYGLLPGNTRSAYSVTLRPLERDGGRRMEGFNGALWFDRRAMRYDALEGNLDRLGR